MLTSAKYKTGIYSKVQMQGRKGENNGRGNPSQKSTKPYGLQVSENVQKEYNVPRHLR